MYSGYEGNEEDEHINELINVASNTKIVFCKYNVRSRLVTEFEKMNPDQVNTFEYDVSDKYSHPLICDQAFRKENAEE